MPDTLDPVPPALPDPQPVPEPFPGPARVPEPWPPETPLLPEPDPQP